MENNNIINEPKSTHKNIRIPIELDRIITEEAEQLGPKMYSYVATKYIRLGLHGIDPLTMVKIQTILDHTVEALTSKSQELADAAIEEANELWRSLKL